MFNTNYSISKNRYGFTLIELLIAMAITTIVSAGIFTAYRSQQDAQLGQKQIVEMQQNLRAAMYIMTGEIRMAGYDPYGGDSGAEIAAAGDGSHDNPLAFTFVADDDCLDNDNDNPDPDNCSDANVDETGELKTVKYDLYDAYSDGDNDIGRRVGDGNRQVIAENIAAFEFTYLDADGNVTATLSDIRSIQISMEATIDSNETDYTNGKNRTLSTTVKCRNMGL